MQIPKTYQEMPMKKEESPLASEIIEEIVSAPRSFSEASPGGGVFGPPAAPAVDLTGGASSGIGNGAVLGAYSGGGYGGHGGGGCGCGGGLGGLGGLGDLVSASFS